MKFFREMLGLPRLRTAEDFSAITGSYGRNIQESPVFLQSAGACVACSVAWIVSYVSDREHDWKILDAGVDKATTGTTPLEVLEYAKQLNWIEDFVEVENVPETIESALRIHPLIFLLDFDLDSHSVAAYDVDNDGNWKVMSWGKKDIHDTLTLPRSTKLDLIFSVIPKIG